MYSGFLAGRGDPDDESAGMQIGVFLFPDAAAATKAATSLADSQRRPADKDLEIPGRDAARAVQTQWESLNKVSAVAFEPAGSTVMYVGTSASGANAKTLGPTIAKALKMQADALQGYKPTPADKLDDLPVDPSGLLSLTLPTASDERTVIIGAWPAQGALHLMIDYEKTAELFEEAGVDATADDRSFVYRAQDAAGARKLIPAFIEIVTTEYPEMKPLDKSAEGAEVSCLRQMLDTLFYCVGAVDRIAFNIWTETEEDLDRSLESQVAMLTA